MINLNNSFPFVSLEKAISTLKEGSVVAIPTETVYGLAGWIHSEHGLKKIFEVKKRPFFDPLIVHVDTLSKARNLSSHWTDIHEILARNCWPGPLTLITQKKEHINSLITSGLDSVGIRCPNHPLTLKLLSHFEGGLAAPSANKFGKTSPTQASHVAQELEDVPILEGGPCEVGIESTVVGIEKIKGHYEVKIYRPGFFTAEMISHILKENHMKAAVSYSQSPVAPGQLKHHYMPQIPIALIPENLSLEHLPQLDFKNPVLWHQPISPLIASRELYEKMRFFEKQGHDIIFAVKKPEHESEQWLGVWNRLTKAKTYSFLD